MAVLVSKVLGRAAKLLNDDGMVGWTQTELLDYFNEGQLALVKLKPDAKTKTVDHQLVAGAKQTNPADCIEIIELRQNKNGAAITRCDRAALDAFSPNWMTTPTGTAVKHYMDDPQPDTFWVYPAQTASPAMVVMTYAAVPATVSSGGNMDVRDVYEDNMVNYILFRSYSKNSEGSNANKAIAFFEAFKP